MANRHVWQYTCKQYLLLDSMLLLYDVLLRRVCKIAKSDDFFFMSVYPSVR